VVTRPSRIEEVRTRGRDLNTELGKDARAKSHSATSTVPKVIYSSPVKNLRAAAEVAKDLLMSTHASVLVDSVGPPSAEVCRAAASFP
jgi:hypothetical protein